MMLAVTSVAGVADPFRITLFGAGTCLFGALLVTDPLPGDRVRTFGWAAVVVAVTTTVTVYLGQVALLNAAVFLVVLMFLSFALRSWSVRAGSLAGIGVFAVVMTSAGHISLDRIGWFVTASTVGFAWLAIWQRWIVRDRPADSVRRSVYAFSRCAADLVAHAALLVDPADRGRASPRAPKALRDSLGRVTACRRGIDNQLAAIAVHASRPQSIDQLRVTLYSAQAALERIAGLASEPHWTTIVGDAVAASITAVLNDLAAALNLPTDAALLDEVAHDAQLLRAHLHDTSSLASTTSSEMPPNGEAALTSAMALDAVELVVESVLQAVSLANETTETPRPPESSAPAAPSERSDGRWRKWALRPTTALAVQAVVAALAAGLIARWIGIEQSRVVAFTAFLVIAGSAGASIRRARTRIVASTVGATAGVVIAATVPRNSFCIAAVFVVAVFFTIVTAPVSYPAMVFWLSIATVPLSATEGLYLDLIRDQALAALIGGCVAAVVALTVAPIRLSRELRPAVLRYLEALDEALEEHLPGHGELKAKSAADLDRAHSALDAIVTSADGEIQLLPQPGSPLSEQRLRIDTVHEAFVHLVPLLGESPRRLLGWTDAQLEILIRRLQGDVEAAKHAARADPAAVFAGEPLPTTSSWTRALSGDDTAVSADALRRINDLHSTLTEFARALDEHSGTRAAAR
jgi:uncharacterized membrane protein YccC